MAGLSYEECRRQRMEENKKRMEELNLLTLSKSLKTLPTPSPVKRKVAKPKPVSAEPIRRSSRVADKPQPNYKEDLAALMGIGLRRVYKRRDLLNRVYASDKERVLTIERAEQLQSALPSELPSCIKPMLQSHVTGGFWLSLPKDFSITHLPQHDEAITLVDSSGKEWETKYLAAKNGLSGGWRGFSLDHELVDGDALIFQLIDPTTLKVFIVRVNGPEDSDDQDIIEGNEDNKDVKKLNPGKDKNTKVQTKYNKSTPTALKVHTSSKRARTRGPKQQENMEAVSMSIAAA